MRGQLQLLGRTSGVGWQLTATRVHKEGRAEAPVLSPTAAVIGVGTGEESRSNLGMRELRLSLLRRRLDLIYLSRLARMERQPDLSDAIEAVQSWIDLIEGELGQLQTN